LAVVLGIHIGHDAACAVVADGRPAAAIQLERVSRHKHHGLAVLSDELPISECLALAGADLGCVDLIVSSFQAIAPGGCGLHLPVVDPTFSTFDNFDARHRVISHHLAHAWSAVAAARFEPCAVLVSDLAGSTTLDGNDFDLTFSEFYAATTSGRAIQAVLTEQLSMYRFDGATLHLLTRDFVTSHSGPRSFVCSPASLYENVTARLFDAPGSHGQTMALAAFASETCPDRIPRAEDMVEITANQVQWRNDWQHRIPWQAEREELVALAHSCQQATEWSLAAHARDAVARADERHLAVAGGSFLNILANSRLASDLGRPPSIPSAPHDAGIALGCAWAGWARLCGVETAIPTDDDRLGSSIDVRAGLRALERLPEQIQVCDVGVEEVVRRLAAGQIVARAAGRAEYGPRALGARSLLAAPYSLEAKSRLNAIKGRQSWRPVAPIVTAEGAAERFDGPLPSPFMTFAHRIRPRAVDRLAALAHADGTTRAQTLARSDDPWLHDVLVGFGHNTGHPVLVNTSLNGRGEPLVETAEDAVSFFARHCDVDALLLNTVLVERATELGADR